MNNECSKAGGILEKKTSDQEATSFLLVSFMRTRNSDPYISTPGWVAARTGSRTDSLRLQPGIVHLSVKERGQQ